jgi:predicted kinase
MGYADWDHKVIELSRDVAFQLVAKGIDVSIDEGFWAKETRDLMRRRSAEAGAESRLYYLDTPIETIRNRVAQRSVDPPPDSHRISDELLDYYLPYWQPPGDDEGYVLASDLG